MEHPTLLQRLVSAATVETTTIAALIAAHRKAPPHGVPDALERLLRRLEALQTEAARLADATPPPYAAEVKANAETIADLKAQLKAPTPAVRKAKAVKLTVSGKPARSRKEIEAEVRAFLGDPTRVRFYGPDEKIRINLPAYDSAGKVMTHGREYEPNAADIAEERDRLERRVQQTVTAMYQDQFGPKHERYPR